MKEMCESVYSVARVTPFNKLFVTIDGETHDSDEGQPSTPQETDEPIAGPSSAPHEGTAPLRAGPSSSQSPQDVVEDDSTSGEAVLA